MLLLVACQGQVDPTVHGGEDIDLEQIVNYYNGPGTQLVRENGMAHLLTSGNCKFRSWTDEILESSRLDG